MKQISYQEAIELMAFGGRTNIYMGRLDTAHDISIEFLRDQANDGMSFFVDDSEAWEKDKAVPVDAGNEKFEEVPVPGGREGETVKLIKSPPAADLTEPMTKPKTRKPESKTKRKKIDK